MLRKILFAWFMLFAVPAWALAPACKDPESYVPVAKQELNTLLYQVDDCQSPPSYIFGTLHTDDKDVIQQARPAFRMIKRVDYALFELVSGSQTQSVLIGQMMLPSTEESLADIVGQPLFDKLYNKLQHVQPGFPKALLNRYKPWAASILLQFPPNTDDGVVLDDKLQQAALNRGIPIGALETASEQMAVFADLSKDDQIAMLKDSVENITDLRATTISLFQHYQKGNLKGIASLGEGAFKEISKSSLRQHLKEALIDKRNARMAAAMLPSISKRQTFVAVGALHLPGKGGVLERLEEAGYKITPVP